MYLAARGAVKGSIPGYGHGLPCAALAAPVGSALTRVGACLAIALVAVPVRPSEAAQGSGRSRSPARCRAPRSEVVTHPTAIAILIGLAVSAPEEAVRSSGPLARRRGRRGTSSR